MASIREAPLAPCCLLSLCSLRFAAVAAPTVGRLGLACSYLDDVTLAGDARQVAEALDALAQGASQAGPRLNPGKTELVLAAGGDSIVDTTAFPAGVVVLASGDFSILGAPIGTEASCGQYSREERLGRATPCLAAIGDLPDAQTALLLLRSCAGFAKFSFATRVTPPWGHATALDAYDGAVMQCFAKHDGGPSTPMACSRPRWPHALGDLDCAARHPMRMLPTLLLLAKPRPCAPRSTRHMPCPTPRLKPAASP